LLIFRDKLKIKILVNNIEMALSNVEIEDLAYKMKIPLVFCDFKSALAETKLQYNKSYIINMEDEFDPETGERNGGSHYTCFQVNKYKNGKVEGIYFDSFGVIYPTEVEDFCKIKLPYSTKNIQSITNSACGWYCLAFLHFINSAPVRSGDLYTDASQFTELFEDLEISKEHLKNEFILKHFFRSSDPDKRKPIEITGVSGDPLPNPDSISGENNPDKKSV
jgi:hypothetical protein